LIRPYRLALASGALSLAACQPHDVQTPSVTAQSDTPVEVSASTSPSSTGASAPSPSSPLGTQASENDGSPDITTAPLAGDAAKTEKGARALLLAWARGIELREFDQAWSLMGDAAKGQTSKKQFNAMFQRLRDLTVAVPGGDMEGAAGSIYYTVPTTVTGTRADGSPATLKGDVILRRVNDVDGATPEQLKWHIEQMNLKPA
jgi:hypothetical protein